MAHRLLSGVPGLIGEHPFPGPARALAFLPSDLLNSSPFSVAAMPPERFDLVEQQPPGDEAVESLLTRGLALHLDACGAVKQHYAGRSLVYVLPTMAAAADKGFFNVRFPHPQRIHALDELVFFFRADRVSAHGARVTCGRAKGKVSVAGRKLFDEK